ncbi:MAG: DUF402 domain-containing protein [Acidimicrobiales bacterium]
MSHWLPGDVITRREMLGYEPTNSLDPSLSWVGRSWLDVPARVVQDNEDGLAIYVAQGTKFVFPEGAWPTPDGLHPWHGRPHWEGHGCLMLQQPGDHHAVWHFWVGPERRFHSWYINLQTAFRRIGDTLETQDLELDLVVAADGSWEMKDWDDLETRIAEGRYSEELVEWIRALGLDLGAQLDEGKFWWDPKWAEWSPPPEWT